MKMSIAACSYTSALLAKTMYVLYIIIINFSILFINIVCKKKSGWVIIDIINAG